MKKLTIFLMILIVLISFVGIKQVYAIPILQLTDGATTVTITDQIGLDLNPAIGAITYVGPVGNFYLNVSTGITVPALGTLMMPIMDLNSVDASSLNGGSLNISFTETGFGPMAAAGFITNVGGTTSGTVDFHTYIDSTNAQFGTGTLLAYLGAYPAGPFSGSMSTLVNPSNPFSMTVVADISHPGAGTSSFNLEVKPKLVPEPGTFILMGLGLIGLGGAGFLRRGKKNSYHLISFFEDK